METEILKSICQLAKWAGNDAEIKAVETCLYLFKMANKKESTLMRTCEEAEGIIYRRKLDIQITFSQIFY